MTLCGTVGAYLHAQELHLQPTPQKAQVENSKIALPESYHMNGVVDSLITNKLQSIIGNSTSPKSKFNVFIGKYGDKAVNKFKKLIPTQAEGYYLNITPKQIVVAGRDNRGMYYGLQTLAQLIQEDSLRVATITDFPDIAFRGVVEGFYGTPWSHAARLRQLEFYGKNKLNTYIYGPKDDPYHTSPNWRKPYPEKEATQIGELIAAARQNEVDFVWAIHPGRDIQWNEADRDALIQKFESMYALGVRSFAVFFDDISGEGTKADRQAELLNYIDDHFVKVKKDVTPLIMCPTEYNKSWSNVKGGYLTTLGDRLNPGIEIMWTGDRVIACIDKPTMEWINPLLKRKAYIWWNFPVSDYVRDHLLLGATYGNGLDIKDDMSGFVANPMERAEASKIALYSVADYAWNLQAYDSIASWKHAIRDLMPTDYKALQTFAAHNSDLGPNGHGFRRDESTELTPVLKQVLESYRKGETDKKAFMRLSIELNQIVTAADILLTNEEAPYFVEEVTPWLNQFKLLGEYGQTVMTMCHATQKDGRGPRFDVLYRRARALLKQMYRIDATENQNPYQPGVKTGSLILLPTLNELFALSTERYNKNNGTQLDTRATYNPYTLESNVPQLAKQPVQSRHSEARVSPSNEVIKWPAGAYVTIHMESYGQVHNMRINLGTQDVANKFRVETSADGVNWSAATLAQAAGSVDLSVSGLPATDVRFVRLSNITADELQVYFKQFTFGVRK